ncbi:MAG: hypothetical protein KDB14_30460, partial [Planctomycetales bacterium]|nr:hypothetical protein [Planctomycetales bacterium]
TLSGRAPLFDYLNSSSWPTPRSNARNQRRNSRDLAHQPDRTLYGFAKCLMSVGDYSRSRQLLAEAYGLSPSDAQCSRMEETLGDAAFGEGELQQAYDHYLAGLSFGGQQVPRTTLARLWSIGTALAIHVIRDWFPAKADITAGDDEEFVIRLFSKASNVGMFISGPKIVWPLLLGINVGERFQGNSALARSYALYSVAAATVGLQSRAANYERRATDMMAESNDFASKAAVKTFIGVSAFGQARHDLVERSCNNALTAFKRVSDKWLEHVALFHLACGQYASGRMDEAIVGAHETFLASYAVQGTRTNCAAYLLQRASEGLVDIDPYLERVVKKDGDTLSTCNLDKALGISCLARQQTTLAIEHLERACQRPRAAWLPNFHAVAGLPLLVGALRLRFEELLPEDPQAAAKTLRRAWRLARRGLWLCPYFPVEHAPALREYALVAELRGRVRTAESFLQKSCSLAENQNAAFELAQSRYELARLRCKLKKLGAEDQLASAGDELAAFRQIIRRGAERVAQIGF